MVDVRHESKPRVAPCHQPLSISLILAALYHVLVSPAETLRLPLHLFFTMATCYPNGNEGVLHSITHTSSTSTATVSKKRIKHGLLLDSDLMSCKVTEDENTGDQPVVFLTCPTVSSCAACLGFWQSRIAHHKEWFAHSVFCNVYVSVGSVWSQKSTLTQYHYTVRPRQAEQGVRSF